MNFSIDHIGYVVHSIEENLKYYKKNFKFSQLTKKIIEPAHNVELLFVRNNDFFTTIELISPLSKKSKVYNFLQKNGDGFHHIAYQVEKIENAILHFSKLNAIQICDIVKGAGHNNTKTVWMYTEKKQLIELIEIQKNKKFYNRFTNFKSK